MNNPELWTAVSTTRWRRQDGAEVWKSEDTYHSNPVSARARLWEGAGPGSLATLNRARRTDRRERFTTRRRFGSAQTAMAAVDIVYPYRG